MVWFGWKVFGQTIKLYMNIPKQLNLNHNISKRLNLQGKYNAKKNSYFEFAMLIKLNLYFLVQLYKVDTYLKISWLEVKVMTFCNEQCQKTCFSCSFFDNNNHFHCSLSLSLSQRSILYATTMYHSHSGLLSNYQLKIAICHFEVLRYITTYAYS